jgi:NAD+ diphosphatase
VNDEESGLLIPESLNLKEIRLSFIRPQFLARLDDLPSCAGELEGEKGISDPFSFMGIRSLLTRFEEDAIQAADLANQLVPWNRNHHFCCRCGAHTESKADERARVCPRCCLIRENMTCL